MAKRLTIIGTVLRARNARGEGRRDRRRSSATSCRCSPTAASRRSSTTVLPLDRAAEAYELVASDATFGKVILDCREPRRGYENVTIS